ncbi:MAG: 50S ribosomal protein L35 [Ruminococcaceae bacterium]|nr:50S ribosomal protein L35 [Oscillospiraceae bacterium]
MPKIKTHKASAKRFSLTKSGKVKRGQAYRSHILTKKSTKRKRGLRKSAYASVANEATIKRLILYK